MSAAKKVSKKRTRGSRNGGSEPAFRMKCIQLVKRIDEIDSYSKTLLDNIERSRRGMQRLRLERAFLLEQIEKTADLISNTSERSNSPDSMTSPETLLTLKISNPPPKTSPKSFRDTEGPVIRAQQGLTVGLNFRQAAEKAWGDTGTKGQKLWLREDLGLLNEYFERITG